MWRRWFSSEQQQALSALWGRVPHTRLIGLLLLMVWVGLTEGVGVLLLVPLLGVLAGAGAEPSWVSVLLWPFRYCGLEPGAALLLSLFFLLVVLRSAGQYWRDELGAVLQHQVVDDLRKASFNALLHVEWRWVSGQRQADHANLLLSDVSRIGVGLHFAIGLLASIATVVAWSVTAFFLSWQMTLLALCGGGMLLAVLSGQRRAAVRLGVNLGQANRALQANVQEALQGIRLAKILGSEHRHLNFFIKTVQGVRQQQLAFTSGTNRVRSWTQVAGALVLAVFLYAGLTYGRIPVAELLILVLIFARLIPLLMNAQQQFHHCLHAWPALQDAQRLLSDCEAHAEPVGVHEQAIWPVMQDIRLDSVTVQYAQRERAALNDVSLVLPARSTTALMGPSGSGKSTLADVVMGLLLPDGGAVRIDGHVLDASNRMCWRRSVAYVPQEVFLFHDTIRHNLLLACPYASEADCVQALKMAAAEFVLDLPQGIDTWVGDGGVRLSGGERQRIGLARALLGRPSLLILDEATSALDTENESRVRQAIEAMHGQVTTLIIGHRLPTLEHADQVIQLSDGHVLAQGTWAQVQQGAGQFKTKVL
jgi:ATP-binding cassette, subfamily C, bacterial